MNTSSRIGEESEPLSSGSHHASPSQAPQVPDGNGYQYIALKQGEFRLLTFLDDGGLTLSISVHEIGQAPTYIALSYTWRLDPDENPGPVDRIYRITLNGKEIEISLNLYNALRHLAADVRRDECMFWADAICINQADVDERADQVPRMRRIFEDARAVYGWLGMPLNSYEANMSKLLMEEIRTWWREGKRKYNGEKWAVVTDAAASNKLFPFDPSSVLWEQWRCMARIFALPFWSRLWILQEITRPGMVQFYYGRIRFNISHVRAVTWYGILHQAYPAGHNPFVQAIGPGSMVWSAVYSSWQRKNGACQSFLFQMIRMRTYKCEDERDKVFVPVSCATDVASHQVLVDYRQNLLDVYINGVRFCLSDGDNKGLDFLSQAFLTRNASSSLSGGVDLPQNSGGDSKLPWPSWVPDWRIHHRITALSYRTTETETDEPRGSYVYKPIPNAEVEAKVHGLELELRGHVRQDLSVMYLTDSMVDRNSSLSLPKGWYDDIVADGGPHLAESVRRSLVGNIIRLSSPELGKNCESLRVGDAIDWSHLETDVSKVKESMREGTVIRLQQMHKVCCFRRMARVSGDHIAVVPMATEIGDQVAAFFGGGCLYMVRSIPGRKGAYSFVGECYVDGLMDGAFLDGASEYDKIARGITLV